VWKIPKKPKNITTWGSSNVTTGHVPKGNGLVCQRDTCTLSGFVAPLITVSKESMKMSINRWMDRENLVSSHMEYYLATQRMISCHVATQMRLEDIHLRY
jgi:hypothetical protein